MNLFEFSIFPHKYELKYHQVFMEVLEVDKPK